MKIGEQVGIRTGREGRVTFGILDSVEGGRAVVVDGGGQRYERDIKRVYGRERAKDMALVQFQRDRERGEERRKRMATKQLRRPATNGSISGSPPRKPKMGKKLAAASKRPPAGLRGEFTRHFRVAIGNRSVGEVSDLIGVSADMVRKYIGGSKMPEINQLPGIAKALGLSHWTEFFDAKK